MTYKTFSASITLNYFRQDPKRTLEIVRQDETIELNFITGTIINLKTQEELIGIGKQGMALSYLNQMKYFLSACKKNEQTINSLKESLQIIKTVI